ALDRPDLRITQVAAPGACRVGATVNVSVLVEEIRGYRGATFNVVLMEGGTVLDTVSCASGDPRGSTSARFAVRFAAPGLHALTVQIVDAAPGEYDVSNNSASFAIDAATSMPTNYLLAYQRIEGEFSDNYTLTSTSIDETPGTKVVRTTEQESRYQ